MYKTLVYWHGIIGIPGKGPHYMEPYDPNRTIRQIIQNMTSNGFVERNKRVEILKFKPGTLDLYNISQPYWSHDTKLSDYINLMGSHGSGDIELICVFI